jgi:hypothetical protein
MSGGRRRRPSVPILLAVALMATLFAAPVGAAGTTPTLRLFVSSTQITVERNRHGFVSIDPGAWVTPVTDDFELWVSRPDYDTPITIKQVDAETKAVLRTFSAKNLEGWTGLKGFGHYVVEGANGEIVLRGTVPFCPNSWQRERLSDDGPIAPDYPGSCGAGFAAPFTKGSIWGLDLGWAAPVVGGYDQVFAWKADGRKYTVRFSIDRAWTDLLSIAPGDATAEIHVTVVDRGTLAAEERGAQAAPTDQPYPSVPVVTDPDPDALPDLLSTPAYSMQTYSRRGHEYLGFAATAWNAGPGTLVVEGFRGPDETSVRMRRRWTPSSTSSSTGGPWASRRSASWSSMREADTTTGTSRSSPIFVARRGVEGDPDQWQAIVVPGQHGRARPDAPEREPVRAQR